MAESRPSDVTGVGEPGGNGSDEAMAEAAVSSEPTAGTETNASETVEGEGSGDKDSQ